MHSFKFPNPKSFSVHREHSRYHAMRGKFRHFARLGTVEKFVENIRKCLFKHIIINKNVIIAIIIVIIIILRESAIIIALFCENFICVFCLALWMCFHSPPNHTISLPLWPTSHTMVPTVFTLSLLFCFRFLFANVVVVYFVFLLKQNSTERSSLCICLTLSCSHWKWVKVCANLVYNGTK